MAKAKSKVGGSGRKKGREKRKKLRKGSPISQYVRGKISFEAYYKSTK